MNRLLLPLLMLLVAGGCARTGASTRPPEEPVPVHTATVVVERVALPVTATGTLTPKEDVALSFKVGGVVSRVLVDEGQSVRAGQLLASLDLGEIDPAVSRARSAAEKADRDLVRARRLYADSVATLEQVQNAQTARDVAGADLESARFNRRHAVIVAPSAGVILRRQAEPGELVQPGAPILVLGSHSRGQVMRAGLADRDVMRVHPGDRAVVHFDALPGREFVGHVSEIAAAADPTTGTYRVEVSLAAIAEVALVSGLVGAVEIAPASDRALALVPAEAVLEADGSRGTVFTLTPDGRRARRRAVTLAFLIGDRIAVAAGLEGVRTIITDGAARLEDGRLVEVQR